MDKYAVIVAGGEGTRLGGGLPKQFRELKGRPLLWWSMKAFHDEDPSTNIIVVLHPGFMDEWRNLFSQLKPEEQFPHKIVAGGSSRTASVKNGLKDILMTPETLVAIHDAARPLASKELIARGWEAAQITGGAVPAVPVTDSLRHLGKQGSNAVDRNEYVAVQTPQVFLGKLLAEAYSSQPDLIFSDDASAFEAAGGKIELFEGSHLNMKVTNPGDLEIVSVLMDTVSA